IASRLAAARSSETSTTTTSQPALAATSAMPPPIWPPPTTPTRSILSPTCSPLFAGVLATFECRRSAAAMRTGGGQRPRRVRCARPSQVRVALAPLAIPGRLGARDRRLLRLLPPLPAAGGGLPARPGRAPGRPARGPGGGAGGGARRGHPGGRD